MSTTSPLEYERRIHALERQCATLAAEIDKMRPVVEAAQVWGHNGAHRLPELARALIAYEAKDESKSQA